MACSLICCNGARMRYGQTSGKTLLLFVIGIILITTVMVLNLSRGDGFSSDSAALETPTSDDSLNYGIVFDCGSSGTRVYIYYWPPHSGDSHELLDIDQLQNADGKPISKKITPGLSTYSKNTSNSAEYLKPLLEFAASHIPDSLHSKTPLYILATAGMRLIPTESAKAILEDISKDIPMWFDFNFDSSHAEVIAGKVEGMYAWISLNYMLGKLPHGTHSPSMTRKHRQSTVGVIDMGGGSLQIAFEVEKSKMKNKDKVITFSLGGVDSDPFHTYSLYVTTFLGFGANSAMSRYKDSLISRNSSMSTIKDNCQALGATEEVEHKDKQYTVEGTGNVTACMLDIKPLLNQTTKCSVKPCSLDGVYQPSISSHAHFYGISEYWYSMYDVLGLKGTYNYETLLKQAQLYCGTAWTESMAKYRDKKYPHADMERMRVECFKVSWIMTVFHEGLHFSKDFNNFLPVNEIDGDEVQWSLGALIHRTRHLANQPSQRSSQHTSERSAFSSITRMILPYALIFCFVIVITAILVYCRSLKKMNVVPSLKSIPSMSLLINPGQVEQGLVKEPYYYP